MGEFMFIQVSPIERRSLRGGSRVESLSVGEVADCAILHTPRGSPAGWAEAAIER